LLLLYSIEREEWKSGVQNETPETGADSMIIRNLDGRVVFCMGEFIQRVTLAGFVCCGLVVTGCGGSGETPTATADSSDGASSADAASMDQAAMDSSMSDPAVTGDGMNDPSMQASTSDSMEESMDESMDDQEGDAFGDTSLGDGEAPSGDLDGDLSLASAEMEAAEAGSQTGDDDAAISPEMAASESGEIGLSDPNSDPAAMSAEMDESAGNVGFGPGSEAGEFGEGPGGPGSNGAGGSKAQEPSADSADYPAYKVVMGLMQGKHDGLKGHVSTRGRGLIEKIRSGSFTTKEKEDLKKTFAQPQLVGKPRTIRGSRSVILNSAGQIITLVSKKQGSAWKVSSISIRAAKKR
jgi:hypothetical protein